MSLDLAYRHMEEMNTCWNCVYLGLANTSLGVYPTYASSYAPLKTRASSTYMYKTEKERSEKE